MSSCILSVIQAKESIGEEHEYINMPLTTDKKENKVSLAQVDSVLDSIDFESLKWSVATAAKAFEEIDWRG